MIIVDVHVHLVRQVFPPAPQAVPEGGWPQTQPLADGRASMMIGGHVSRIFEPAYWDVPACLAYMDAEGVAVHALTGDARGGVTA